MNIQLIRLKILLVGKKDIESDFIKNFKVQSIPRYILLDKKGVIIDANAPRPSAPEL